MSTEIAILILGFGLGFIAFLIQDVLRRKFDEQSTQKKVLKNLISEINENKKIQYHSTWVPLQKSAWEEAKTNGVVLDLADELRTRLTDLYARITEKNADQTRD